jgi:hypothetical protein
MIALLAFAAGLTVGTFIGRSLAVGAYHESEFSTWKARVLAATLNPAEK